MRTCPNCKELNGDNRTTCWKCKTSLGPVDTYKKICLKCKTIYSQNVLHCDQCGEHLSVYTETGNDIAKSRSDSSGCWLYAVSVLIPLVGIILGCIYIARQEDDLGKSLIITGVVSNIAFTILAVMLGGCAG